MSYGDPLLPPPNPQARFSMPIQRLFSDLPLRDATRGEVPACTPKGWQGGGGPRLSAGYDIIVLHFLFDKEM